MCTLGLFRDGAENATQNKHIIYKLLEMSKKY